MTSVVNTICRNTYKEMIRDRVLYFVVVFTILFMGLCFALGQLSYDAIFRLSVSLGLGGIHLCFMGLSIFLGCSVFYREIERKTIYTLLARPVSREKYLIGKYLGLVAVLLTLLLGFTMCFTLIELLLGMPILLTSYYAFIGFFVEACVLLAIAFFFSTFSKPFLAITGSLSLFLVGHWVGQLEPFIQKSESLVFKFFARVLTHVIPDLELVNWRNFAIVKSHVPIYEVVFSTSYCMLWALFFLLYSLILFRRKDFE